MSRRSVTRAVCAPLAIALVTTAVPPAISNSAAINQWTAKALSATLVSAEAGASRASESFSKHAQNGAEKVVQMREELSAKVSVAVDAVADVVADAVSSSTDAALARVDSWMTSVSQSVLAMLPSGGSDEQVTTAIRPIEVKLTVSDDELQQTASIPAASIAPSLSLPVTIEAAPIAAAAERPAPQVAHQEPAPGVEKTGASAPAAKLVVAALEPAPTTISAPAVVATEVKVETAAAPLAEAVIISVAKPAAEIPAEVEAAPLAESKAVAEEKLPVMAETVIAIDAPIRAIESQPQEPKAEEKLVVASLSHAAGTTDAQAIAASVPAVESKAQENPETKADDKIVVASLGHQNAAADVSAAEFKGLPASEPVSSNSHVIDPLQMTNVPMSSPLKIRALTRADIPSAEKVASLGPSNAANNLPAEQQRVAYDAPIPLDEPMSIGRRKWTEEAAKYQGLGSPEALLEALKHMGAGAKSLGLPASLWCADFMNLVLRKSGIPATGSRAAKSYLQYGKKIDEPRVGAIAIFSRGSNGGHIGIVRGTDGKGNPIIVSGNHNHKVAEAIYPKERVLAYVVPR